MCQKIILSILFVFLVWTATAQEPINPFITPSQLGTIGLLYTPSAYMCTWPTVDIGFTHHTEKASLTYEGGTAPERAFIGTLVFLPRLELSFKLTRPYSNLVKDPFYGGLYYGIGDRSLAMRYQVLKEKKHRPAIVIGIQDPLTNLAFFSTNYIVLSKRSTFKGIEFASNLGYGITIGEPHRTFLKGPFGGIQAYWKSITGLIEYDTERLNIGLAYRLKEVLFLKVAMINGQHFTGNISIRFKLKP